MQQHQDLPKSELKKKKHSKLHSHYHSSICTSADDQTMNKWRFLRSLAGRQGEQFLQVVRPQVFELQHARSCLLLLVGMPMASRRRLSFAGLLLALIGRSLADAVAPLERKNWRISGRGATAEAQLTQRLLHVRDREVEHRAGAAHGVGGLVVGERGGLGRVEGADPHALAVARRVPYLRRELAPRPLPHPDHRRRLGHGLLRRSCQRGMCSRHVVAEVLLIPGGSWTVSR
jgi:hypothetical protein